jgi:hypothetical protein
MPGALPLPHKFRGSPCKAPYLLQDQKRPPCAGLRQLDPIRRVSAGSVGSEQGRAARQGTRAWPGIMRSS